MSKHTPGPWEVTPGLLEFDGDLVASGYYAVVDTTRRTVCRGLDDSDARLIAAAPDLLAVLRDLSESAEYWGEYDVPVGIVNRIRDAIAKATGVKP